MNNRILLSITVSLMCSFVCTIPSARAQSTAAPAHEITGSIQTAILVPTVSGNKEKFQEDHWTSSNPSGGISDLNIVKQLNQKDSVEFVGRAIPQNNDYNADLTFSREGVGRLEISYKELRKYYDGTGGYFSLFPRSDLIPGEVSRDLHLDVGDFKIMGVLAKEDSPEYSLSYERSFRDGSKSSLHWGTVTGSTAYNPKIYPGYIGIDETVDTVTAGIKKVTSDAEISGEQSWEHVQSKTNTLNSQSLVLSTRVFSISQDTENTDSDLYTTLLRVSKDLKPNLTVNCGLLFNRYVGGGLDDNDSNTNVLNFAAMEQNSITVSPNIVYAPSKEFSIIYGIRGEFLDKLADSTNNNTTENINITTRNIQENYTQSLHLKYSGIKNASLFADLDVGKKYIDLTQNQEPFGTSPLSSDYFLQRVSTEVASTNFNLGYKWYTNSQLNITLADKNKSEYTSNDQKLKVGDITTLGGTYRGFITAMHIDSNTPSIKVNYKPLRWISSSLGYSYELGLYGIQTQKSPLFLYDRYTANIYSLETTVTPADSLYFTVFYQKQISRNKTRASDISTTFSQPEYTSNIDVLSLTCNYAPTAKTTLTGSYSMSRDDAFHNTEATTLPLGLTYLSQDISAGLQHKLSKATTVELKYTFSKYAGQSNDGIDNYNAHLIYAALTTQF